jgi:hypothetical protein
MRHTILAVILAMGSMGAAQAAEKIRYEDIPNRLAIFGTIVGGFRVKVVTRDGSEHTGRALRLGPNGVLVLGIADALKEEISSEDIARIEIRRGRHLFDSSIASATVAVETPELVCGFDEKPSRSCMSIAALVLSPFEAAFAVFAVGSAPVTLAFDGAQFLLPPRVFEIVP